jgi:histo-blood group ABO system transferase
MVSVLTIATGLYSEFVQAFTASAIKYVKGLRQIYLFSDGDPKLNDPVAWLPWGHLAWPYPTLLRYRAFAAYRNILRTESVLLYVDVDMRFVGEVDVRGVKGIVAVQHPGYVGASPDQLPFERRLESRCRIPVGDGQMYYAGGVQGGNARVYLDACERMADWVQTDLSRDIIPIWHDESAWNKHCQVYPPDCTLSSRYCSPEYSNDSEARIVALDKDHDRLRQIPRRNALLLSGRTSVRRVGSRIARLYNRA